jgi:hypothetical protein
MVSIPHNRLVTNCEKAGLSRALAAHGRSESPRCASGDCRRSCLIVAGAAGGQSLRQSMRCKRATKLKRRYAAGTPKRSSGANCGRRHSIGWGLLVAGAASTIPLAIRVLGKR